MRNTCISTLSVLLLLGCGDTITVQEPIKGSLAGVITVYGRDVRVTGAEHAAITVESLDPQVTVEADANGSFVINDLQTGAYNLTFSKEGFGTYKIPGYAFVGGDEPASLSIELYQLPVEWHITGLDMNVAKNFEEYQIYGTMSVTAESTSYFYQSIRFFLSTSPDVSASDYLKTGTLVVSGMTGSLIHVSGVMDLSDFSAGTELYMVFHPYGGYEQTYTDVTTGDQVYTCIIPQPSPLFHFTAL